MSNSEVTVSPAWAKNLVSFVSNYEVSEDDVWNKCGIDRGKLKAGQRLTMDETVLIWRACVELTKDDWFGLHLGLGIRPNVFHVVGYTLMNSSNLEMALQKLSKYQRLVSDGGSFQQLPSEEGVWLIYHSKPQSLTFMFHQVDAVLSALLTFSQWVCNEPILPIKVSLQRDVPAQSSEYLKVFGVEPEFNARFDGLLVSRRALEMPLPGADPELRQLHELYAKRRLDALSENETMPQIVERMIELEMGNPALCRKLIADQINWSEKKLQRYLASKGLSFKLLQDKVRNKLSIGYVADTDLPLAEVSEILGFSDNSAFNRAFKRWQGVTPGAFRRKN